MSQRSSVSHKNKVPRGTCVSNPPTLNGDSNIRLLTLHWVLFSAGLFNLMIHQDPIVVDLRSYSRKKS